MKFTALSIPGAYRVAMRFSGDERGGFARIFCEDAFRDAGLPSHFPQHSLSWTKQAGTIRGMHFQWPPYSEGKLVRCLRGAMLDVVVDLREESPTYLKWESVRLVADGEDAVFVPAGCAHGFQTLADETLTLYLISERYEAAAADGIRYDDSCLNLSWPLPVTSLSERDCSWPDWTFRATRPFPRRGES